MLDNLSTNVIVGKRGVITLPVTMRNQLEIKDGEALKVTLVDGKIIIELLGGK